MLSYVPASVCRQLSRRRVDVAAELDVAAAELRRVTVLFVRAGAAGAAARSGLVPALQRAIGAHEGDVNKILVDEKPFLAPGNMFGFLTGSKPNPDRRESAFAGALRRGSRRVSSKTDGSHRSSTTSQGSNDRRGSGDRRQRADSRGSG